MTASANELVRHGDVLGPQPVVECTLGLLSVSAGFHARTAAKYSNASYR
jgi:hypothetical protein